jgi:hypothetical protein
MAKYGKRENILQFKRMKSARLMDNIKVNKPLLQYD